jgi:hypothetical protein
MTNPIQAAVNRITERQAARTDLDSEAMAPAPIQRADLNRLARAAEARRPTINERDLVNELARLLISRGETPETLDAAMIEFTVAARAAFTHRWSRDTAAVAREAGL